MRTRRVGAPAALITVPLSGVYGDEGAAAPRTAAPRTAAAAR
ncbi:hypothetical protein [Microtetraspora niveoalba]|nr:hypothetical protein [Microtetraspora niveoalba]